MEKDSNTVLIIGSVWPEPNSSAAGYRMLQLITCFQEEGYHVIFSSPAMDSDFMVNLEDYKVEKKNIKLNCSSFDEYIKELNPTIVLFDRFMMEEQFGWRVAENCPQALRLLDTEDLHCLRLARQKAFKEKRVFEIDDLLIEEVSKREIASILRCDLSLIISKFEMYVLESVFKVDEKLLFYLPFLLDTNAISNFVPFDQRKNYVFIGNFLHEPNWNAVQYLKETIWPLIKQQQSDAELHIYGAYPSQKVLQLHNPKQRFHVQGRAVDAQKIISEARVLVAPLRFGAGLKGKLVESMQYGTPTVTTAIGAEAMHEDLPWNGFVENDVDLFAQKMVELYNNEKLWLQSQQYGVEIITQCYDKSLFESQFKTQISNLLVNLFQHRKTNFFGNLLQHHSFNSTKYMSRWIEEKNKK
ncbi:glycosyltransferase [Flavobacterium sp. 7A]|uniref:glycosyltransferase n=1 Tax=Flavobacterium sp. 7A TaxID=2940571 RepID=UPI002226218C|nr:glycosyltransferase family 4 protein [Flavobacterium sp. 7A]MCW2117832.1 glycosyltransferase involved in cell wall biosynthesis [Flavobacterium sp. 7A]